MLRVHFSRLGLKEKYWAYTVLCTAYNVENSTEYSKPNHTNILYIYLYEPSGEAILFLTSDGHIF